MIVENPVLNKKAKPRWLRRIQIILTSKKITSGKNQMIIGDNPGDNLNINISGSKFLAINKDSGLIEIQNLSYETLVKIMLLEYYIIEIKIGYDSSGDLESYFKGEISYISQKIHSKHDSTTYISYASEFVARFSQYRINCNYNSSINVYAAMNYLLHKTGISSSDALLSDDLKNIFINQVQSYYNNPKNIIDNLVNQTNNQYTFSVDSSSANPLINCSTLSDKRYIKLNPNNIIIQGGNPTVSSEGLRLRLIPTFNFRPGDIINVPRELIDISIASADVSNNFSPNFVDPKGDYMIIEINYNFQNRGSSFDLLIKGKAVSLFENITGNRNS